MISEQLKIAILKIIENDLNKIDFDRLIDDELHKSSSSDVVQLEKNIVDIIVNKFSSTYGTKEIYVEKVLQQLNKGLGKSGIQPLDSIVTPPPLPSQRSVVDTTDDVLTNTQIQALQRTRQNEAAWIQGVVSHELFVSQGIDPSIVPTELRDQIFQEVWDELQGYDQNQLKSLFANTTARRQLLQKTYTALGQNPLFTEYITQLAASDTVLAQKISTALKQAPNLTLPNSVFNQIRTYYDLSLEPHLVIANIENFSYSVITTAALQEKNPYTYIDSLTPNLISVHFGIELPPETDLTYLKTVLKSYIYVESLKLKAESILPDQIQNDIFVEGTQKTIQTNEISRLQGTLKSLNIEQGIDPHLFVESVYSKYGDIREQLASEVLRQEQYSLLNKKQFIILNYYQNLDATQKQAVVRYFEGLQPNQINLTSQQFNFPPDNFSLADFIRSQSNQPPKKLTGRIRFRGKPRESASLKNRAFAGLENVGVAGAATAADVLLPGSGFIVRGIKGFSDVLDKLGIRKGYQAIGIGGLVTAAGIALAYLIRFLLSHPIATLFGAGGMLVGGPFLAVPAFGLGYLVEDGAKKIYGSLENATQSATDTIEGGLKSVFSGPTEALKSGWDALFGASSSSALPITGTFALITTVTVANNIFTQSAFIQPLPTIDAEGEISPYVTVEKTVQPGVDFAEYSEGNFPDTPITYTIRIAPKEDYSIAITSMEDIISTNFNSELKPDASVPDETVAEIAEFFGEGPLTINPGEEVVLPAYQRVYGANYLHSNVTNTFQITFTVDSGGAEIIEGEQTAQTAETICFGECPQIQSGCWPTDGIITTEPYSPTLNTHKATDAFDIGGTKITPDKGPPVFAIFDGEAIFFPHGSGIFTQYGNHVFVVSEGPDGKQFALIYAHLNNLSMSGTQQIEAGTFLGDMGTTGNSSGVHLHLEARTAVTDYPSGLPHSPDFYHTFGGFTLMEVGPTGEPEPYYTAPNYEAPTAGTRIRPSLLDLLTPEGNGPDGLAVYGEAVRTCYEK